MIQCTSREDRLYVLATVCNQKGITPNSNTYMTIIQTVCCGKFLLAKTKARELAQILTSAYHHDHWAEILGDPQLYIKQTEASPQRVPHQTAKYTPKQEAKILFQMAKRDTYNGVGRLQLSEVQFELGKITAEEILETWMNIYPKQTIVQQGNIFLIYWAGKETVKTQRSNMTPINLNVNPSMQASKEYYYVEPEYEKTDESANKSSDKIICGETSVDDSEVVEADAEDSEEEK